MAKTRVVKAWAVLGNNGKILLKGINFLYVCHSKPENVPLIADKIIKVEIREVKQNAKR